MTNFIVKIKRRRERFEIYVNDMIHLSIYESHIIGFHSYIDGYSNDAIYTIKFYTRTRTIKLTYDSFEKFNSILTQIEKHL